MTLQRHAEHAGGSRTEGPSPHSAESPRGARRPASLAAPDGRRLGTRKSALP